jgi:hypothetical protein
MATYSKEDLESAEGKAFEAGFMAGLGNGRVERLTSEQIETNIGAAYQNWRQKKKDMETIDTLFAGLVTPKK